MPESIQHKLDRVRRPRVQITYDVETLGSIVKTELPFVVGIMADLSGNSLEGATPDPKRAALKDRKFIEIDRDSFNPIMERVGPKVKLRAETLNAVGPADPLVFRSLDDFDPKNVLDKVPALKARFEMRTRLSNLLAKLDGNPQLQEDLMKAIKGLGQDERDALNQYVKSYLSAEGQAGSDKEPDLTKLSEEEQDDLKVYIVKKFPETMLPDLKALATALTPADQKKLTTYVVKKYPLTLWSKLSDADKKAVADSIGKLDDPSLAGKTVDPAAVPTDPKSQVEALSDANKKQATAFILEKLTAAITAPDLTVLDALGSYEKDEVKSYAGALNSAKLTPIGEGGIGTLVELVAALNTDDRQRFMKYVASTYPVTVKGDQS